MHRHLAAALVVVASVTALVTAPAAHAIDLGRGFQERPDLRPGDLAQSDRGFAIRVPQIGYVGGTADGFNRRSTSLDIFVDRRGRVFLRLLRRAAAARERSIPRFVPEVFSDKNGCRDSTNDPMGAYWHPTSGRINAWVSSVSRPSYLGSSAFREANMHAIASMTGLRNTCGLRDFMKVAASDKGYTSRTPNIPAGGSYGASCAPQGDGVSVTGFGGFGGANGTLAVNCRWATAGFIVESDTKINVGYRWTANPSSCPSGYFDLRGILTHEWGHGFGLSHANQSSSANHPELTMDDSSPPCLASQSWLGKGDVLGLQRYYG